jgi:hypothetical protein
VSQKNPAHILKLFSFKTHFNACTLSSIRLYISQLVSSFQVLRLKFCTYFSFPRRVLNVQLIITPFIFIIPLTF